MRSLLLALLTFLPCHLVLAQDEGRAIRFRTLCFEFAPGAPRDLTVSGDPSLGSSEEISLSRRISSAQHDITVIGSAVSFGTLTTNDDGQTVLEKLAIASLPGSGSQFLFLLVPSGKKEGEIYRCLVLPDEGKSFPPGAFRFVNLSPSKLRFAMGKQTIEVPSGSIKVLEEVQDAREDGRFPYIAQHHDGNTWNRLSTGYWTSHKRIRSLQVVYFDPRTKRLTLRGFDDKLLMRTPS